MGPGICVFPTEAGLPGGAHEGKGKVYMQGGVAREGVGGKRGKNWKGEQKRGRGCLVTERRDENRMDN